MSKAHPQRVVELPSWLAWVGSVVIVGHLAAVALGALAAPSGPWPTMEGSNMATPPQFAYTLHSKFAQPYLRVVRMTNNYHFPTNRTGVPEAYFEVRLRDENKKEIATLRFPDENANGWVRHRQSLLARWLADDQPVMPPQTEVIPAPNQPAPTVQVWMNAQAQELELKTIPQHLIPRDRPVFQPSEVSLLLARSYARYLCREHGAASAEIIRHTKEALAPVVLYQDMQGSSYDELLSNFGEMSQ